MRTKALTKAEKLRKKRGRGRPRIEGVAREPNGRISRSGIRHEPADVVALEARRRIWGLTEKEVKDQMAATFVGRLRLLNKRTQGEEGISQAQYDASQSYLALREAYLRAIQAPGRLIDAEGTGATLSEDEYEDWVRRTKEAWKECSRSIMEAQCFYRHENLFAALDLCVVRDEPHEHLVGSLRTVLNYLARHFKVPGS